MIRCDVTFFMIALQSMLSIWAGFWSPPQESECEKETGPLLNVLSHEKTVTAEVFNIGLLC